MESSNLNFKNFGTDMPGEADGGRPQGNFPLTRQSSIYSLTFDEFQNTVGSIRKDFGSINMDELLKNIWSAEENQNIGSTSNCNNNGGQDHGNGYLQRQGSLTLPRTLSQKTADEVWRDVVKEYGGENDPTCSTTGGFGVVPHRQPTLGEVTLEEFLARARVVKEETQSDEKVTNIDLFGNLSRPVNNLVGDNSNQIAAVQSGNLMLNVNGARSVAQQQTVHQVHLHQQQQQQQQILPKRPTLRFGGGNIGISDRVINNGVSVSPWVSSDEVRKSNGGTSYVSPVPYVFNGDGGLRGRKIAVLEKVVERRQRRMIKNRESAARSRARKQEHTMELEADVAKLKEENELLQKKHAEVLKMQKNQVLEMMKQQNGNKRRCLRRTQTGSW